MRARRLSTLALALFASLVIAAPALAGGWATATLDGPLPSDPSAGESLRIGFTLKQHGRTPISWEEASIIAINRETNEAVYAPARAEGALGEYVADVTFPSAGTWDWRVETRNLLMESRFRPLQVKPGVAAAARGAGSGDDVAPTPTGAVAAFDLSDGPLALAILALGMALGAGGSIGAFSLARRSRAASVRAATR